MTETLRERQRRETREHIAATAAALFAERGYDGVTVEEVARAAGVSRKTVFNHFPSKEDLVFDREQEILDAIVAAVRDRPPGTSPVEALRAYTVGFYRAIASHPVGPDQPARASIAHLMSASPSLRLRALEMGRRQTEALAAELVAGGAGELDAAVAAQVLVGVQGMLLTRWAARVAAGATTVASARVAVTEAERAYDLAARGLGDWGRRARTPGG